MNYLLLITILLTIIFLPHLFFISFYLFGLSSKDKVFYRSATICSYSEISPSPQKVPVSICLPVLNGEKDIIRRLENIAECVRFRSFEIIVYNDGSNDTTKDLVLEYIQFHPESSIKLVDIKFPQGRARASNYFHRHALYDVIVCTDVDTIYPDQASFDSLLYPFDRDLNVGCSVGSILPPRKHFSNLHYRLYLDLFERPLKYLASISSLLTKASGPNSAYKKSLFVYDIPDYSDYDHLVGLVSQLNSLKVYYRPSAFVYDSVADSHTKELNSRQRTISKSLVSHRWLFNTYYSEIKSSPLIHISYLLHRSYRPISFLGSVLLFSYLCFLVFSLNQYLFFSFLLLLSLLPLSRTVFINFFFAFIGFLKGIYLFTIQKPISGSYTPTKDIK